MISGQCAQPQTVEPIPDSEDVGFFIGGVEAAGVLRVVW